MLMPRLYFGEEYKKLGESIDAADRGCVTTSDHAAT
jgi:hypothetical protein